ncbi:hypothetical protein OSB04_028834 [Centaurea solstitialis]|uniref:Reverse transcriptase Ty1/copia-type domain-containing protein n=1 Tax=Centaurea solstitialis TaxID=347529 RepID=A0AA38SNY6_9ASTR|nr:hypothetical protein OSB04_028834 [Centaurea solstitialis]
MGFSPSISDHSLFIYAHDQDTAYLLLYVDDIVLTTSSERLRKHIISRLSTEFSMKDLGRLSYFLGIAMTRHKDGLFLSQHKYAAEVIKRAGMASCRPSDNTKIIHVLVVLNCLILSHFSPIYSHFGLILTFVGFGGLGTEKYEKGGKTWKLDKLNSEGF